MRIAALLAVTSILLLLAACGQKGELYRPESRVQIEAKDNQTVPVSANARV